MTSKPDLEIADSETLYRAIYPWNKFWKEKFNKVSSAAFKVESGLSVDRDVDRDERQVIQDYNDRKMKGYLLYIGASKCREIGTHLIATPSLINDYHAEIRESPTIIEISDEKCLLLSESSQVIPEPLENT